MGSAILSSTSGGSMVGPGEKRYFFSTVASFRKTYRYYCIKSPMSILFPIHGYVDIWGIII
jgi:hypothetical protein